VNVVDITDFDCPACQQADKWLRTGFRRPDIHFVRIVAPMRNHENAWPAGRAYLAAVRQGKGEPMATALYDAASRDPAACRAIADRLGLDLAAYDRALDDPAITDELTANAAWVRDAALPLPSVWVQDRVIIGVPRPGDLEAAIAAVKPHK
jgi:2-hydroxychromene-2-carboxylate isomerase